MRYELFRAEEEEYRVTHQVVPKLSIQNLCNSNTGIESLGTT